MLCLIPHCLLVACRSRSLSLTSESLHRLLEGPRGDLRPGHIADRSFLENIKSLGIAVEDLSYGQKGSRLEALVPPVTQIENNWQQETQHD